MWKRLRGFQSPRSSCSLLNVGNSNGRNRSDAGRRCGIGGFFENLSEDGSACWPTSSTKNAQRICRSCCVTRRDEWRGAMNGGRWMGQRGQLVCVVNGFVRATYSPAWGGGALKHLPDGGQCARRASRNACRVCRIWLVREGSSNFGARQLCLAAMKLATTVAESSALEKHLNVGLQNRIATGENSSTSRRASTRLA